jgi:hypothetical protein
MARKILLETAYTFTPSTNTIVIPKTILQERLLLITNVTKNEVIYNFSDPSLGAVTYTATTDVNMNESTTIVFAYNTAAHSTTDKLSITIDTFDESFTPAETQLDPTNKLRVSTPQSLIDTDFEYGTQVTKWENLGLYNNRPFAFASPVAIANISGIAMSTGSKTVTVTLSTGTAPANGTPITVIDTYLSQANGNFIVESGGGGSSFTYTANARNTSSITAILDANKTLVYQSSVYSGAVIGGSATLTYSGTKITATTTIPHGLALGNEIVVVGASASTNPPNGNMEVAQIISATQFAYYVDAAPTGTITGGISIYVRPQAQFMHRPFDGGVIFASNAGSNYASAIRQTRRYFRYQSGKGVQISSGTILKPYAGIDSITAVASTVTVQTKEKHNIQPGTTVKIGGCNESAYNGTFVINNVLNDTKFTYTTVGNVTPSSLIATGNFYASIEEWYGCTNRLGAFDAQNGLFFEYDGTKVYAVKRSSTFQVSGKVSVTNGSSTVTRTNASLPTYFSKQLAPGDYIVLRGQSYKIQDIASDVSMTITPAYRGATADYVIASKTIDTRIPQSEWNIDKVNGQGPSQYNMDLAKMQMFYIDYTWYGAGFVRWGVRGPKGNVIYVHKMPNNNINTEAYMRSGNLPGRYESSTIPPYTFLTQSVQTTDNSLTVASTTGFPSAGTLVVRNASTYEYINYSGKSATSFTGLTRGSAGNASLALTVAVDSNQATVSSTSGLQVGQRVISTAFPEGTFISSISGLVVTLSKASLEANPTVIVAPMGATSAQAFTYAATAPICVELAYPTFSASISHWGTSVIMDGRFDDDKSLVFTYGQAVSTSIATGTSRALFSIRVAPSVDNGIAAAFGARELINRMQLTLRALDITTPTANSNLLVTAILNGIPSSTTTWTNAVGNITGAANSSLAQIADYAAGTTTVSGGEITAGFFVGTGANSIDLTQVRDLGNSILGGGSTTSNTGIYPDGPDTLTIVVRNLGAATASVFGRLSWTEAQA